MLRRLYTGWQGAIKGLDSCGFAAAGGQDKHGEIWRRRAEPFWWKWPGVARSFTGIGPIAYPFPDTSRSWPQAERASRFSIAASAARASRPGTSADAAPGRRHSCGSPSCCRCYFTRRSQVRGPPTPLTVDMRCCGAVRRSDLYPQPTAGCPAGMSAFSCWRSTSIPRRADMPRGRGRLPDLGRRGRADRDEASVDNECPK